MIQKREKKLDLSSKKLFFNVINLTLSVCSSLDFQEESVTCFALVLHNKCLHRWPLIWDIIPSCLSTSKNQKGVFCEWLWSRPLLFNLIQGQLSGGL